MDAELNGGGIRPNDVPKAKKLRYFWVHNQKVKNDLRYDKYFQEKMVVSVEKVTKQCRKMESFREG